MFAERRPPPLNLRRGNLPGKVGRKSSFASESEGWRRRPDLNRGWRFCRPLPYHLATAPIGGLKNNERPARGRSAFRVSVRLRAYGVSARHSSPEFWRKMERETGFEPATSTLARSHSTTELFPLARTPKVPHGSAFRQPRRRDVNYRRTAASAECAVRSAGCSAECMCDGAQVRCDVRFGRGMNSHPAPLRGVP
jgi:hypothetical protein